jgi:hypothetical protein
MEEFANPPATGYEVWSGKLRKEHSQKSILEPTAAVEESG